MNLALVKVLKKKKIKKMKKKNERNLGKPFQMMSKSTWNK
jgi:hypothetical protein